VLQQQTKALTAETETQGKAASKQIESVKHLLWHGNVEEALDRIDSLFLDLDLIRRCEPAAKLARGIAEFRTYIRNNRGSISNFGERSRQGETITTAFVESTINQVVSRRFVKKQQMVRRDKTSMIASLTPGHETGGSRKRRPGAIFGAF
jgi:hypothetical protein